MRFTGALDAQGERLFANHRNLGHGLEWVRRRHSLIGIEIELPKYALPALKIVFVAWNIRDTISPMPAPQPHENPLPHSDAELSPCRAIVVPRAFHNDSSARVSVDQLVLDLFKSRQTGLVFLTAPTGGGKTTALRHVRAVIAASDSPQVPIRLFEVGQVESARTAASTCLAVLAVRTVRGAALTHQLAALLRCSPTQEMEILDLCPWNDDDCLEYLAVVHRPQCASVMKRLATDGGMDLLNGSPQHITLVMDRMAGDPLLGTAGALRKFVLDLKLPKELADLLMFHFMGRAGATDDVAWSKVDEEALRQYVPGRGRWWTHKAIQRVLQAEWIVDRLVEGTVPRFLSAILTDGLLGPTVTAIHARPSAVVALDAIIRETPGGDLVPMAASVLLAFDPNWRPPLDQRLNLRGAVLRSARWSGIKLEKMGLSGANLAGAELYGANLIRADLMQTNLSRANLSGAKLDSANFQSACLASANLRDATGDATHFMNADLTYADFTRAVLTIANFCEANLENTCFQYSCLHGAVMRSAKLGATDFRGADLKSATLDSLDMRKSDWTGASFVKATLRSCNLERLRLPETDFTEARLAGSLLTGTRCPRAKFRGADLRKTGLAEIVWNDADLTGADFSHATFHMGSSRSGLVGSLIPGEGSKTGFYTDDYHDREFKPPYEIRKACLTGCDLRGAIVEGTDFYLVDLRDALYTADQEKWFTRCGAILNSGNSNSRGRG